MEKQIKKQEHRSREFALYSWDKSLVEPGREFECAAIVASAFGITFLYAHKRYVDPYVPRDLVAWAE